MEAPLFEELDLKIGEKTEHAGPANLTPLCTRHLGCIPYTFVAPCG